MTQTYKAERRFFLRGKTIFPGEQVELEPAEAHRLQIYVSGPLAKPKRSRRRRRKDADATD